jgi:uncharacterized protein (DUF1800 family)
LINRAGFGVPTGAIDRLASLSPAEAVGTLVDYDRYPDNLVEPDWLLSHEEEENRRANFRKADPEAREKAINDLRREQREQVDRLKSWWLDQMRATSRPLQEKMTLFWHGHFATSAEKVREPDYNYGLNQIFRTHATGNFRDLVFEVGKSPAMLIYLDNRNNRKGEPNENWARELMELFTMGIGNYTEEDIKEAARAFSGYTLVKGEFRFVAARHDFGDKTFLGISGPLDGADVINRLFEQPAVATHIATKLWEFFVYENPDKALIEELGAVFRDGDYELKPLLRTIFLSQEFYSARAVAGLIKSPAQFLVSLQEQLGLEAPRRSLLTLASRGLGQDLFYPPNVKGWDGNRAWINTNTLLTRYNIPAYLVTGKRPTLSPERRLDAMGPEGEGMMEEATMQQQQQAEKRAERRARTKPKAAATLSQLEPLFTPLLGKPCSSAAAALADHFIGRPLDRQQLDILSQTLAGDSNDPLLSQALVRQNGPEFLHLLLSIAEYQLC